MPDANNMSDDEVVVALYNWSLVWVAALSILTGLSGLFFLGFGVKEFLWGINARGPWFIIQGALYLIPTLALTQYYFTSKDFVKTETDTELLKSFKPLTMYWFGTALLLVTAIARAASQRLILIPRYHVLVAACFGALAIALALVFTWRKNRQDSQSDSFSRALAGFGKASVTPTRFAALAYVFLGVVTLFVGVVELWRGPIVVRALTCFLGVSLCASGFLTRQYLRSVKDIDRNPVRPFLEVSHSRLNFYWLIATISAALQVLVLCAFAVFSGTPLF